MKTKLLFLLFILPNLVFSQSRENILDSDLYKMKFLYYNNLPKFVNYLSYNMKISEEGLLKRIKNNQEQSKLKSDSITYIYFKNISKPTKFNGKYQSSFTKAVLTKTPSGKVIKEYSMVGIFDEYDKHWKFIDSSILTDDEIKVHFSTLSEKMISSVKPMVQYQFDENQLLKKCNDYRNIELESISPFTFDRQRILVYETEKKDITDDNYYLMNLIRYKENPCLTTSVLKGFKKEISKSKIGDELDMEIIAFDNNTYYFTTKFKNDKRVFFDKLIVVGNLKP
ncbi:hypothetical protein PQ459_12265 [Chryseobacterium sp. KACC 21268]|nr:hypothetical protein PQ459_12265 [Chryseobacterium sp. KACC 21268]